MPAKTKNKTIASKIRIAILEDNPLLLSGMKMELDKPDFDICSASDQPDDFISEVKTCQPDIAIVDLRVWNDFEAGFKVIRQIREMSPRTQCIIYTFYDQLEYFHAGINLGIRAFLSKNINEISLEKVIRIVSSGGAYYGELLNRYLDKVKEMPSLLNLDEPSTVSQGHLSDRELEILRLFGENKDEDAIAEALTVSVNTIKAHTKNIRGKLNVKTTIEALRIARLRGLF
jgi:DNA-binding NarL/FixJ family response regulator